MVREGGGGWGEGEGGRLNKIGGVDSERGACVVMGGVGRKGEGSGLGTV